VVVVAGDNPIRLRFEAALTRFYGTGLVEASGGRAIGPTGSTAGGDRQGTTTPLQVEARA
jgi:hypothetical protein